MNSVSGQADQIVRRLDEEADRNYVINYVGIFTEAEDDVKPTWYSAPRQILFSIKFDL